MKLTIKNKIFSLLKIILLKIIFLIGKLSIKYKLLFLGVLSLLTFINLKKKKNNDLGTSIIPIFSDNGEKIGESEFRIKDFKDNRKDLSNETQKLINNPQFSPLPNNFSDLLLDKYQSNFIIELLKSNNEFNNAVLIFYYEESFKIYQIMDDQLILNDEHPEKFIDYLVNLTGVLWFNKDISVTKINFDTWDKVFEINLKSMGYLVKLIVPKMKKNKFGSMVHISSIDALSGDNNPQDAYGASKAALIQWTKYTACELAKYGIRVNAISPGAFPNISSKLSSPDLYQKITDKPPIGRVGSPNELIGPVVFLASNSASYVTGVNLPVDGGWTAW